MHINNSKQNAGNIMVGVMVISFLVIMIGIGLFGYARQRLVSVVRSHSKIRTFWAAEGGHQFVRAALNVRPVDSDGDPLLPGAVLSLIEPNSNDGQLKFVSPLRTMYCSASSTVNESPKLNTREFTLSFISESPSKDPRETSEVSIVARLPSVGSFGWGVRTSHKLLPASTSPDLLDDIVVHTWHNDSHKIMGPFYSGDAVALDFPSDPDDAYDNPFGGLVIAPQFYDKTYVRDPLEMVQDSDGEWQHPEEQLSRNLLEERLENGWAYAREGYDPMGLVADNWTQLRDHPSRINVGGVSDSSSSVDEDVVWKLIFHEDGTYDMVQTKAQLELNARAGVAQGFNCVFFHLDLNDNGEDDFQNDMSAMAQDVYDGSSGNGDIPVFADWKFVEDPATRSTGTYEDGDIISVNGDALISGVVDGNITLVADRNVFIDGRSEVDGVRGIVYESMLDRYAEDWHELEVNGVRLGDAEQNNQMDAEALSLYLDAEVDDMLGISSRNQVIILTDMTDLDHEQVVNVHASIILSEDVDTDFAENGSYDVVLHEELETILSTKYQVNEGGEWVSIADQYGIAYDDVGALENKLKQLEESGETVRKKLNEGFVDLVADPEKYIVDEATDGHKGDRGIPEYFFKSYGTTGMHPWNMLAGVDGQLNFFGSLSQYRHSRFIGGGAGERSGLNRKFLYDTRTASQYPPGFIGQYYVFYGWQRVR